MATDLWVAAATVVALLAGAAVAFGWALQWAHEAKLGAERRRSLPPGDMGWPIIGNIWAFFRAYKSDDPDSFINSFVSRFGSTGIYKAFMYGRPTIMIASPDGCKQVLMNDENFVLGWPKSTCELIGKRSFILISKEEHKWLRKLTASSIKGHEALNTYLTFIERMITETFERWSSMGDLVFLTEVRQLTFRVIMKICLGLEDNSVMETLEKLYADVNQGLRAMAINLPGFTFHRAIKARKKMVAVLQRVLDERRATRSKGILSTKKDMMDNLIDIEDENGRRLTDDEIIDTLSMYVNAGHESSGHITMWATIFLQENPKVFEKAKAEQEEIRRNLPSTQKGLTFNEVRQMKYLSQVIDETLRVVNLSFVTFRRATKDTYINGYLVPKDWRIMLWYRNVHMNPQIYSDPKTFDPSRWDDNYKPKPRTFLVFGGGTRLCPGNDLAKMEMSVFLHHFLLNYKLTRKNPDSPIKYLPHPHPADNCIAKITEVAKEQHRDW